MRRSDGETAPSHVHIMLLAMAGVVMSRKPHNGLGIFGLASHPVRGELNHLRQNGTIRSIFGLPYRQPGTRQGQRCGIQVVQFCGNTAPYLTQREMT